jgi:hypothetical protein
MHTGVLDAGALVAIERNDFVVRRQVDEAIRRSVEVVTSAAVVAQVWRNESREALLARLLRGFDIRPLGPAAGRRIGELLAVSRTIDVVDGHVALLVRDGDVVLTSDPRDIGQLVSSLDVAASTVKI